MILKSHFPLLPIRPFRAFLLGFLRFSGVYMSIASNISTAFYSDCNTFATPAALVVPKESLSTNNWTVTLPDFVIDFGQSLSAPCTFHEFIIYFKTV